MSRRDNRLVPGFFKNFPLLEEDFWELGFSEQSGLSVYEDDRHVCVEADLPGLNPEEIGVTFEKGTLWIRGKKKEEEENKEKRYYKKALSNFSYQVYVPGLIDERTEPDATYKNGVMKVTFMKSQQQEAKKINIRTS